MRTNGDLEQRFEINAVRLWTTVEGPARSAHMARAHAAVRRTTISLAVLGLGLLAIVLQGCATTGAIQFGELPNHQPLLTLMVSTDPQVIGLACRDAEPTRSGLGCERLVTVPLRGGVTVKAVTVVRYADAAPSALALEIEAHEMCHAVAAVQVIADPCHAGNNGQVRAAATAASRAAGASSIVR